jgi:hypothetical protein
MLTDEDVKNDPGMMGMIEWYWKEIQSVGYENESLVDQLNMAINFSLLEND